MRLHSYFLSTEEEAGAGAAVLAAGVDAGVLPLEVELSVLGFEPVLGLESLPTALLPSPEDLGLALP